MVDMNSCTDISKKGELKRWDGPSSSTEKSKQYRECRLHRFLLSVALLLVADSSKFCLAQSFNDAVTYLNNVENEVMSIAAQATENFVKTCDLVETCGESCSRQSCEPLQGDLNLLTCKNVALNPSCSDTNGNLGCSQLRVTLAKSFVRVPTTSNVALTSAANFTICSQRMLDPVFLSISRIHNSAINLTSWYYLGSVEGVQRSFPGRDVSRTKCTFEPRKRPWYMGATAVKKDLIILLDGGNSMGDGLPGDILMGNGLSSTSPPITKFKASVNIIKDLLDTLTYGDRVSVVLFSSSTPANLVKTMIATSNSSDIRPLKNDLDALSVDPNQGTSEFLSGILTANETFASDANVLKIMVAITDGQFADATLLPSISPILNYWQSQKVFVLLYSFDRTETARDALSTIACSVNGTYERIEQTVMNPLWTMRSYFGIIAYWRLKAVEFKPYWSKPYKDSGGLSEVITVAYPVFAPDNYTLIGVVGSDVLVTELGPFATTGFSSALIGRATDNAISVTPEPLRCNVALSTLNSCPETGSPVNPLCVSNDTSKVSFEDRVCTCPPQCIAPERKKARSQGVVIGGATGGGVLALIVTALVVVYCCRCRSRARKIENQGSGSASNISGKTSSKSKSASFLTRMNLGCLGSSSDVAVSAPVNSSNSANSTRQKSSKAPAWPVGNQFLTRDVISFTMRELEDATNYWSEAALVGRGACGSVYRGQLHGVTRAIKKPHPGVDVANYTFDKELDLLSKLNHKCLVRLIGYCEDEHVLVFEYMEYGTLEDCLHKNRLGRTLSWEERLKIAAGASKGLEYLHEYAASMIIHGDVKPANILLDDKLEAHISDFGLSLSTYDLDVFTLYASRMGGTPGYLDPEYAYLGTLTPKSDVYSFGIVLLEILSGRKVVHERKNITSWAAEMYEQDVEAVLDPRLEPPKAIESWHSIIALALQCVQTEHRYRPKMKDVCAKLSRAAADWQKVEQDYSPMRKKHPSRRQHPQFRPSLSSDEIEEYAY